MQRYAEAINPIAEVVVATYFDEFAEVPTAEAAELAAEGIGMRNEILPRMHTQALMRALARNIERD